MVIVFLLLAPAIVLYFTGKVEVIRKTGPVTLCYALGFFISLLPLSYDKNLVQTVASVFIAIAIPLILFGFDLTSVKHLAKKTIISFILVILSAVTVSSVAAAIAATKGLEYAPQLAGMATGLYIGGTPNLFAVGSSIVKDINIVNIANISDALFGGVFFLLILSVIKNIYKRWLPDKQGAQFDSDIQHTSDYDFNVIEKSKTGFLKLAGVFFLAVLCLGLGAGLEILINGNMDGSLFIMITVSVLGIAFSLIKQVREVKGSFQIGQYCILVFSLGLSMSIDFSKFVSEIFPVFIYFSSVQVMIMVVHFILCKIFKIDGGTALITGVAGIYGPPFIAPVAQAYNDKSLIIPGVICGSAGLILGNLFGLLVGTVLPLVL